MGERRHRAGWVALWLWGCACGAPSAQDAGVTCQNDPRVTAYTPGVSARPLTGDLEAVLVSASPAPPARGTNSWQLRLRDGTGAPLPAPAQVSVSLLMPDHGHGTSVVPQVSDNGDGTWAVTPLYLFMPGIWQVTVTVSGPGGPRSAAFTFCIAG